MPLFTLVHHGAYHDSVTLMRVSRELDAIPGVERAAAMMGTPANRDLLRAAELLGGEGEAAGPTDLVIGVLATNEEVARAAWRAAEAALVRRPAAVDTAAVRSRSFSTVLREQADANLALISVPGPYAAAEAAKALHAGRHVMLFSDNVSVADEVRLKTLARERDLFVMGPDCGTAIIAGVPLGFANVVPRGRIGIAAASGTGLQAVSCHLAAAGEGVSHAIGVGGRDLSDDVGGLMTERALLALAADPGTNVVCVIGKPPGAATAKKLRGWLAKLDKPWVVHFTDDVANSTATTLEDAAHTAVALARGTQHRFTEFSLAEGHVARLLRDLAVPLTKGRRYVRGVYAGGTLAREAVALLRPRLKEVTWGATASGHRVVDLGDDIYTVGRPHPMIDGTVRREWIAREAADPATAVILLDLVLGYGASAVPASELLPAITAARGRRIAVVASVTGTTGDPQGLARQTDALERAGVAVMPSNAQAARLAGRVAESVTA